MAKRKRRTQYPDPKSLKGLGAKPFMQTDAQVAEAMRSLAPPDPNSLTDDEREAAFRKIMNPKPRSLRLEHGIDNDNIEGAKSYTDVDMPPSPYPFKNPITMTKGLDEDVREMRSIAPGAGTARTNVVGQVPPIGHIVQGARDPRLRDAIMKGEYDPTLTNLYGLAPANSGDKDFGNNVYVNPQLPPSMRKVTVAHELSHRNNPGTEDDYGGLPGGFKDNPSAQWLGDLYRTMREGTDPIYTVKERFKDPLFNPDPKKRR